MLQVTMYSMKKWMFLLRFAKKIALNGVIDYLHLKH